MKKAVNADGCQQFQELCLDFCTFSCASEANSYARLTVANETFPVKLLGFYKSMENEIICYYKKLSLLGPYFVIELDNDIIPSTDFDIWECFPVDDSIPIKTEKISKISGKYVMFKDEDTIVLQPLIHSIHSND